MKNVLFYQLIKKKFL